MIVDLTCPCLFVISGVEVVRPIMYTGKKNELFVTNILLFILPTGVVGGDRRTSLVKDS